MIELRRLEELSLNSSAPPAQLLYEGWLVRLSPGKAKRARSVNAVYASTLPLAKKIEYCERVYLDANLPMLFRITPFSQPRELAAALEARGYVPFDTTLVQAMRLDSPPRAPDVPDDAEVLAVDPTTFADAIAVLRGSSAVQRDAHLERLRYSPLVSRMVIVQAQERTVAAAQIAGEGDVAGVFDVVTASEERRRGHAVAAVAMLLAWAFDHAFATIYLQVNASNAPAIALYRRFGFNTVYTYHYLGRPGACA